jgi:phage gp46-like protein
MTTNADRWGTDLRLLNDVTYQVDRVRGSDLLTRDEDETGLVDLATLSGVDNLSQALLLRFLTQQGEMEILGHPTYGSRLFELIGELNNDRTHNRAKMYVLQALSEEPRVKQVISVIVTADPTDRTRMLIRIQLMPVDSDTPLNLVFPFFIEGGVQA